MAVSGETGIGSVVAAYLRALSDNMDRLSGPAGNRLARTGLDLLGTLFATELDLAPGGDLGRRSLLTEMCHHINANLGDSELSVARIAAEFHVSSRHVHALFQETGVGAAHWIKRRRLEECRRDLADPLLASESVNEIAARWGHHDSAYFSRVFKETFNESPSNWRRRQHVPPDPATGSYGSLRRTRAQFHRSSAHTPYAAVTLTARLRMRPSEVARTGRTRSCRHSNSRGSTSGAHRDLRRQPGKQAAS